MEFEYWWLLALPLFFALGWFARGRERRDGASRDDALPVDYLKGVNLLLDDKPDAAIDAFTDVVRVHPDALGLHFALGALFRRRGETDRAIRVHRNLAERSSLSAEERARARFALGEDYLKAGLIDRAEAAFDALDGTGLAAAAAGQRLEIARMTHDWRRVIELTDSLPIDSPERALTRLHAHAELGEAALAAGQLEQAEAEIAAAREAIADHPRALIDLARIQQQRGLLDAALATHARLAERDPAALPLHAADWLAAARATGLAPVLGQVMARIEAMAGSLHSPDVLRPLALAHADVDSPEHALAWLRTRLIDHPSLLGMETLLEMMDRADRDRLAAATGSASAAAGAASAAVGAASGAAGAGTAAARVLTAPGGTANVVDVVAEVAEVQDARSTLKSLVKRQADRQSRFVCSACGFRGRSHYWQCPGCNRWDTYPATREDDD